MSGTTTKLLLAALAAASLAVAITSPAAVGHSTSAHADHAVLSFSPASEASGTSAWLLVPIGVAGSLAALLLVLRSRPAVVDGAPRSTTMGIAAGLATSGVLHGVEALPHWEEGWHLGAFFAASAGVLLALAIGTARAPSRLVLRLDLLVLVGLIGLYFAAREARLPLVAHVESYDAFGLATKAVEIAVACLVFHMLNKGGTLMSKVQRRSKATRLAVAGTLFAVMIGAAGAQLLKPARAASSLAPVYGVTNAIDSNPAPNVFETTLVADETRIALGDGVEVNAFTFNGTIPGPQIRVQVGDTVVVHFRNDLAENTGIHWHGIELNNASDGSSLSQNDVKPGGTFQYRFIASRPGVYWYHPHHSPSNQVHRGLYAPLIVTDPNEQTLVSKRVLPPAKATKTLVLSDVTVCKKPGENDPAHYPADPTLPWAGGPSYPGNDLPATPVALCETAAMDNHGHPAQQPFERGDIPNIQPSQNCSTHPPGCRINEGQIVLTNGEIPSARAGSPEAPGRVARPRGALRVKAGQAVRLQFVNAATIRFFRLRLTDSHGRQIPLYRVGGEGGLLDRVRLEGGVVSGFDTGYGPGEILLGAASRADVVAVFPRDATGVATLWTLDYQRQPRANRNGYASVPTVPVAHFRVKGRTGKPFEIGEGDPLLTHPSVHDPVEDLRDDVVSEHLLTRTPGTASENIRLTQQPPTILASIEGVQGSQHHGTGDYYAAPRNETTRWAKLGDLLELSVTNTSPLEHTFHLHGFSIQPVRLERADGSTALAFDYPEFRDNVLVPARLKLVFRVRFDDRPLMDGATAGGGRGRWVFHCHIFNHASLGMTSELDVVSSDGQSPLLDVDRASVEVDEGQLARNEGTVFHPEGEPVTLRASAGTVLHLGGRQWTWVDDGDDNLPDTVLVTATDNQGLSNQIAFSVRRSADE